MLFRGAAGAPVTMIIRVGSFGVGAFWLGHYGLGHIAQIGVQAAKPYTDHAVFPVTQQQLTGWNWGIQGFVVRVAAFAPHANPMPISLEIVQNTQLIQARDAQNVPINGAHAPFGSVILDSLTNGQTKDFSFAVHF